MMKRRLQNSPLFAYSSTREQSNKRSGTRLRTESETSGERLKILTPFGRDRLARFRARKTLTACCTDFVTDFEKKTDCFACLPPLSPSSLPFIPSLSLLKCNKIQQNWSVTTRALKINQGTKLGILKKPLFSLFDVITFWFNKKIKQLI